MKCEHAGTGRQARLRGVCLWRVGSSPTARTIILPDSVTVSTSDSDSLCLGSNPSQAARVSTSSEVLFQLLEQNKKKVDIFSLIYYNYLICYHSCGMPTTGVERIDFIMDNKKITLTNDGLRKLEEELEYLKTKKRKEVSEKIKVALGFGDLSENSEYDEAKNEQAQVEIRINELENMLKNVEIIDAGDIDRSKVGIGTKVQILDVELDEADWYTIVGSTEADPTLDDEKTISNECPLFLAISGKSAGEVAKLDTQDGVIEYKILAIE